MLMTSWILLTISVLADLVALIGVAHTGTSSSGIRKWGLPVALIAMTAFATYEAVALRRLSISHHEAAALARSWPQPWDCEHLSDGENVGIILAGLRFLEEHQAEYPDTHDSARRLLQGPLGHAQMGGPSAQDSREFTEAASAMIGLIRSIAEE